MLRRSATPRVDEGSCPSSLLTPRHRFETVLEQLATAGDSGTVPERFVRYGPRTGFETAPGTASPLHYGKAPIAGLQRSTKGRHSGGMSV